MSGPAAGSSDLARQAAATLRLAGRRVTQSVVRHGGAAVTRFDARPGGHRVLLRAIPHVLPRSFDPSSARGLETTFELRVGDSGAAAETFAVSVSGERCHVSTGPVTQPGATVTIAVADAIRLAVGAVGWPELMSSGRLTLAGDPFVALRFPGLFRLPV